MINSSGCLLLHATGVNRAMSSLQSGLVYKYTITFTAERPALPWALGWRSRLGPVPQPCVGRALLLGSPALAALLQALRPALRVHLCVHVLGQHEHVAQHSPREMPRWRCPAGETPRRCSSISPPSIPMAPWRPLHHRVRSSSRRQSLVGALQQTDHIQRPAGQRRVSQPTSTSRDLKLPVLSTATQGYPSKKSCFT